MLVRSFVLPSRRFIQCARLIHQLPARNTVPPHIKTPPYLLAGWQSAFVIEDEMDPVGEDKVIILSAEEQDCMRAAGKLARKALNFAGGLVQPGRTTSEIDKLVHDFIIENGAYPSPLGYPCDEPDVDAFPKSICTSVNEIIAHGIPDSRVLEEGDIIKIDVTVYLNGFHGDCAETFFVGSVSDDVKELVEVNKRCMEKGIATCGPGKRFSEIGFAIEKYAHRKGYVSIGDLTGHGIGREFHTYPMVPLIGTKAPGVMRPGMAFTIVTKRGTEDFFTEEDGWTLVASDGKWVAQHENTILITETGFEILTSVE